MQLSEMSNMRTYQELEPKLETKHTRESQLLLVHIPDGFAREHIRAKVEYDYGRVRIFGEGPLQNNTIKRFNVEYPVPATCDINRLRGRFEGGVVTITMPKKVITEEEPDQNQQPTQPESPKAPVQEYEPSPDQESKPSPDNDQAPKTPVQQTEPSPDKDQDQAPKTPTQETEPSPDRDQDQAPKTTVQETEPSPDKDQDQAPKTPVEETEPSPDGDQAPKIPVQETEPSPDKGPEGIPPQSTTEEDQQKVSAAKVEDQTRQEGTSDQEPKPTIQADSASIPKATGKDQKEVVPESPARIIKDMAASASQAVTRFAKRFDEEDKQKLIYVGAAVVVVALGVYASYKLRTSLRK